MRRMAPSLPGHDSSLVSRPGPRLAKAADRRPARFRLIAVHPDHLLDLHELTVRFHTEAGLARAVEGVSLTIGPGETVVLIGESGAGKSVTGLAVMGLIPRGPDVEISGRDRFPRPGWAGPRSRPPAVPRDAPHPRQGDRHGVPGADELPEPGLYRGRSDRRCRHAAPGAPPRPRALKMAEEMLERLGIPDPRARLAAYPHQISGGMASG